MIFAGRAGGGSEPLAHLVFALLSRLTRYGDISEVMNRQTGKARRATKSPG